jgi:hypothetical protein
VNGTSKAAAFGGVAIISFVANIALSGVVIAGVQVLRFWAYPALFGLSMLLSGLVLIVLLPPPGVQAIVLAWAKAILGAEDDDAAPGTLSKVRRWMKRTFARWTAFYMGLQRKLAPTESRFAGKYWSWARRRGAFAFTLAAAFFVGPVLAALVMRFLGLRDQRAWAYALITNAICSGFWVSVYLGGGEWVRSLLSSIA